MLNELILSTTIISLLSTMSFKSSEYSSYIYTPNNTEVEIVLEEGYEYDKEEAYKRTYQCLDEFPNLEIIRYASCAYNCYSYAFYKQELPNYVSINEKEVIKFWKDKSYIESSGLVDDKIVYFSSDGTPLHAGIVKNIYGSASDLSNIYVISKWGKNGLYGHYANYVPNIYLPDGGYVKFYKLHANNHNLGYIYKDTKNHYYGCLDNCGYIENEEGHTVANGSFSDGKRYAKCLKCGGQAEMGFTLTRSNDYKSNFELIDGYYYIKETSYIDGVLNLSYKDYLNYEI